MTDQSYSPSFDPANRGDLAGTIRFVLTKFLQGLDDMLPAKVISYDRVTNRAQVQPLIAIVTTGDTQVQRAQVASIPVLQLGGGGFVISCPLNAGDLGWIKANDSDISLFLQFLQNSPPNTARLHSFEDGLFIPDTMFKGVTIADEGALVIQNVAGTVGISINENIKMTAPVGVGAAPRAGAIIDAQSTTQALGVPAMSAAQKTAIASPHAGYTVFDTTSGQLSSYNGSVWS